MPRFTFFGGLIRRQLAAVDGILFFALLPLLAAGLVTMSAFGDAGENYFFDRQLIWIAAALAVFFLFSRIDWRFLRRSQAITLIYLLIVVVLFLVLGLGNTVKGAKRWFEFGGFSLQVTEFMKLGVILILAKYFSRRHIEIAHYKHILISGLYALVPFLLIFFQPDLSSALVIFAIWLGVVIFAGISKKHLALIFGLSLLTFVILWFSILAPYQKERIINFVYPLADIRGAGYSSFQSTVAVGSGRFWGKGVGYGTQSRLQFLPEHQTDFIFAAFAEEWGLVGVVFFFAAFGVVVWRVLRAATFGETNLESLFAVGVAIWFMGHFFVNVGMNIGLLPVTGIPLPFTSYGGSHLLAEFAALGILQGMRAYARSYHRGDIDHEFFGGLPPRPGLTA